jgi:hypothetical protein
MPPICGILRVRVYLRDEVLPPPRDEPEELVVVLREMLPLLR